MTYPKQQIMKKGGEIKNHFGKTERERECVCMCIAFNMNSILYLNGIVSFLATKTERATTTLLDSTKELTAISGEVLFLIGVQFQEEGGQFHGGEGNFNCIS